MVVLTFEKQWCDTDRATEDLIDPLLVFILPGIDTRVRARQATRSLATEMVRHRVLTMGELALYAHGAFDGFMTAHGRRPF